MATHQVDSAPLIRLITGTFFGTFESNTDYRLLLLRYCRNGVIICGVFGICVTAAFTLIKLHVNDYRFAFSYQASQTMDVVYMLDKTIIITLSVLAIALSQFPLKLGTYCGIFAVFAFISGIASMTDDILNRDLYFSSGYVILILLLSTICIPLIFVQSPMLCICV